MIRQPRKKRAARSAALSRAAVVKLDAYVDGRHRGIFNYDNRLISRH
jgi:hypothetical protein